MISKTISRNIYILFFILLLVFEVFSLQTNVLGNVNYYAQIVYLITFTLTVILIIVTGLYSSNFFLRLFVFWMIYIILRFFTSTTGHTSLVAFFRYTWFCNCYIITYLTGKFYDNREKTMLYFMILFLLVSSYYTYQKILLGSFGVVDIDSRNNALNIIFWSLCLVPFVFMLKNRILQILIIILETVLVLVTMKRSALISMALILILFFHYIFSKNTNVSNKKQRLAKLVSIVAIIAAFFILAPKLGGIFENNMIRMENIEEDGGSGRTDVWNDALKGISNSTFFEFIFGHGVASTWETINHTSCHNDFLTILLEFGIIGSLLYLIFIIIVFKRVLYTNKHRLQLSYYYTSLLIIFMVVGNVGDLFTCYTYLGYMLVILAILELRLEQTYAVA